jgi:hypothetical protein
MTQYRVYRSIRVNSIKSVNMDQVGVSWAVDELSADRFGNQHWDDFLIVSAIVNLSNINITQTNAQWESPEFCLENEVVLNEFQNITVEFGGKKYNANTYTDNKNDETRPNDLKCIASEVTDYLETI